MRVSWIAAPALFFLLSAVPLDAQWREEPHDPTRSFILPGEVTAFRYDGMAGATLHVRMDGYQHPLYPESAARRSAPVTGELILAGLVSAAIGTLAGGYLGYNLDRELLDCSNRCSAAVLGWAAGSAITTPALVHSVNDERGSLSRAYTSAAAITAASAAFIFAGLAPVPLLAAPIANVFSAIWIETSTSP